MNFGPETSEGDAFAIMDRALELGINFFDTANVYGWKKGEGVTEQIIGRWLAQGGGRREKVVLATKVYGEMGDWPNESRLSARHIRAACEGSLRRLRTDHLDLYQMHHVDREAPWDEIWQAMELLVQQGKIIYVGSSNFAGWQVADAEWVARTRGFERFVSAQNEYNWLRRDIEDDLVPALEQYGIGLLPFFPLASGLLTGKYRRGQAPPSGSRIQAWGRESLLTDAMFDVVEGLEAFAASRSVSVLDVAIGGLAAQPAVASVIAGATSAAQVVANVVAGNWQPTLQDLAELDELTA
jgi:aryl-alcohol dehydrogenase-like predicted oxidoreductase